MITELAARDNEHHVVAQFHWPLTRVQKEQLQEAGLQLLRYVGGHAFFASLSDDKVDADALGAMPFLAGVGRVERRWKLEPRVLAKETPPWAVVGERRPGEQTVAVYVLFHPDVPLFTQAIGTVRRHGAIVRSELVSINGLVIELPLANMEALADEDVVQWIEWPLPRMSAVNDSNRAVTQADVVQAPPYGLDGSDVAVLVYDGGTARATHVDFEGRLAVRDYSGLCDHATHVSGTIGGAGVANPMYRGMAPGVTIESYGFEYDGTGVFLYTNPGDLESDYDEAINLYGADISNNSIGTNTEINNFDCDIQGDYGVTSALIDAIVGGSLGEPFRIVWANGNERQGDRCDVEGYGDYYSTAPPAGAKNHITVGALNSNDDSMTSFSSWGPVDDGRIKPDLAAPGCQSDGDYGVTSCSSAGDTEYTVGCGTSMASPTVCGLSALLLQDFRDEFPFKPDPRNSTLKILLAHNAEDLGSAGPDYQFGYGSVRIQRTIDFLRTGSFLEDQVDQGETYTIVMQVNPGDPELKVTLAWDDAPGTPNITPALVNDLDVQVFDPSSQPYYPWTLDPYNPDNPAVQTQPDHDNNIEQVYVANPATGVWRIEVHGYDVPQGPQTFSLCGSPGLVACSPAGTIGLDAQEYTCDDPAAIQVIDCDLNTDENAIETVFVTVSSDSEPGGESVLLTETGPGTAHFQGAIPLQATDDTGVLLVDHADTVTATYVDADDGQGGVNVPVTTTATVDCMAPVISNVQSTNLEPYSVAVTFDTDEPANGTVRYGSSCQAVTDTANEIGFKTTHVIHLTGLQKDTMYFYAVDAVDELGQTGTDDNGQACYTFTTPYVPDYFTELFVMDNDLDYLSLRFTPDGSDDYYSVCTEAISVLPVSTLYHNHLEINTNRYQPVQLTDGKTVSLYGAHYSIFYVGENGYITFTGGDEDATESLADHFSLPRISGLFDDLDIYTNGGLLWKQLDDRVVVTWQNMAEMYTLNRNTVQVEMHFDGTIVISYLSVDARDGLAGLSQGSGVPADFYENDLSTFGPCPDPTCDDGIQNQGEQRIDCGGPCPPCECLSHSECNDGLYCTGVEICDNYGQCQPGFDPCYGMLCDEDNDTCIGCDHDGTCETGEDCHNCPDDCPSGSGAGCGNGVCETADGEDCVACSDDCNGQLGGKPSDRYCCGDGTAQYGVTCEDVRCTAAGNTCTDEPAATWCCGDGICEGGEGVDNCAVDCGCSGPEECDDSNECTADDCVGGVCQNDPVDDDTPCSIGVCCSGACTAPDCSVDADCDDTEACTSDTCLEPNACSALCSNTWPACGLADDCCGPDCTWENDSDCGTCLPEGEPCSSGSECCSGKCRSGTCK